MKVSGETFIAANDVDVFSHGLNPAPWIEASEGSRISVTPKYDEPFHPTSPLEISVGIDLEEIPFSGFMRGKIEDNMQNGAIVFDSRVAKMIANKRIEVVGSMAIARIFLAIDLEKVIQPRKSFSAMVETKVSYSFDASLTGLLRPGNLALNVLQPGFKKEASEYVSRLGSRIEHSVSSGDQNTSAAI